MIRRLLVCVALLTGCSAGEEQGGAAADAPVVANGATGVAGPAAPAAEAPRPGGDPPRPSADLYRPPLYWTVYEHHFTQQRLEGGVDPNNLAGRAGENFIPETVLRANVDWVESALAPFGYDMVAIDGWGDTSRLSEHGYRASHSRHWQHDFAWWSAHLRARGLKLGMYENPLIVHVPREDTTTRIVGTDLPVSGLVDERESSRFRWVDVERPGAERYVKGAIDYYADMGIDHLRIDFLSWFEDGTDQYYGRVGPDRPRAHYERALRWMREAADRRGMLLSLAMSHLREEGALEQRYVHAVRIDDDVDAGGWRHFSEAERGHRTPYWSQWANAADGFAYWSRISGRDRMRLDGDFIRLNTFATASERRSVVSMHLVAGGPIAIADRHDTIGDALDIYRNPEMLALNRDGFVGRPRADDPTDEASQVWTGRMSDGDTIVALFNRESTPRTRTLAFADVGVGGEASVRDLWQRAPLGTMDRIAVELAPHASLVLRVSPGPSGCTPQSVRLAPIAQAGSDGAGAPLSASASSGLPVRYEVALGPARIDGDRVRPAGGAGTAWIVASQPGDGTWCAAVPVVGAVAVR